MSNACWICLEEDSKWNMIRACKCHGCPEWSHEHCIRQWAAIADQCQHCREFYYLPMPLVDWSWVRTDVTWRVSLFLLVWLMDKQNPSFWSSIGKAAVAEVVQIFVMVIVSLVYRRRRSNDTRGRNLVSAKILFLIMCLALSLERYIS